ncbi:asparagine synthase (glutamine-hydrolyzing) [Butyrivibrio sp. VCB2001]|uniref:asparagine synthase (glutamine-hydrolyzing) n=1 Tax=Butyrivibrio sp. VCB2001 TaxID=1280667 RepID=UPI00042A70CB|nr:asparagine synthase (glutamine-hydrolyzing) [Butyrivibrio sp. VCB2001]
MCGICGCVQLNRKLSSIDLEKMNNAAKHRGPDDEGYTLIDFSNKKMDYKGNDTVSGLYGLSDISDDDKPFFCGLGHRRLSIIDLTNKGHQPMTKEYKDNRYTLTFNGEIYNYVEVKQELLEKGYRFETESDTEVILAAYDYWGSDCVKKFDGMWAFAIFDYQTRELFCSRDRLGAKPFYYYADKECFTFSSEIKQLCSIDSVPRKLNKKNALSQMILNIYDYYDETLILGVKPLSAGCNLVVKCADNEIVMQKYRYWDIEIKDKLLMEYDQLDFESTLSYAIQVRTRSDVPIGALLSGGVDSSLIVMAVSDYYQSLFGQNRLRTFTTCYKDQTEIDESYYANMVSGYCKTIHENIFPEEEDIYGNFSDMIWHLEELIGFSCLGPFLTLKEVGKRKIKVLMNGQGSDELMFGYTMYYGPYLRDVLKKDGVGKFIREFCYIKDNSGYGFWKTLIYYIYFSSSFIRQAYCIVRALTGIRISQVFNMVSKKGFFDALKVESLKDLHYKEIRKTTLPTILHIDDRFYMAFSMESRVPFIDYKYIENAVNISPRLKIKDGYTKYPLREYMQGRLPDDIVWRKIKLGWPSPENRYKSLLDNNKIEEIFDNPRTGDIFNVRKIKKNYHKGKRGYMFEKFLALEIFMRRFDVSL